MFKILLIIFLLLSISLISLILINQSKGMDTNSSSLTGFSKTFFGSKGSANFLTRLIILLATFFLLVSIAIDNCYSTKKSRKFDYIDKQLNSTLSQINK
ncbi:MAG: preprotein translocase subunit SecG [Candidatus Dasytiphilus stammeri]